MRVDSLLRQKLRAIPKFLQAHVDWWQGAQQAVDAADQQIRDTEPDLPWQERDRRWKAALAEYRRQTVPAFERQWGFKPLPWLEVADAASEIARERFTAVRPRTPLLPDNLRAELARRLPPEAVDRLMQIFHYLRQGEGRVRLPKDVEEPDLLVEDIVFTLANAKAEAASQQEIALQKAQLRNAMRRAKRAVDQEARSADATGDRQSLLAKCAELRKLRDQYENLSYRKGPYLDLERWQRIDPTTGRPMPPPTKPTNVALEDAVKALDIFIRTARWKFLHGKREWTDYRELKQVTGRMWGIRLLIRDLLALADLLPMPSGGQRTEANRRRERERLRKRLK